MYVFVAIELFQCGDKQYAIDTALCDIHDATLTQLYIKPYGVIYQVVSGIVRPQAFLA